MTVAEAAQHLSGVVIGATAGASNEVTGGYASDLLSDVMANTHDGDLWVTLQKHANIVAVAHLKGLAGIVLVHGRQPDPDTAARAVDEGVPIVSTSLGAFDVAGILYGLGLRERG